MLGAGCARVASRDQHPAAEAHVLGQTTELVMRRIAIALVTGLAVSGCAGGADN